MYIAAGYKYVWYSLVVFKCMCMGGEGRGGEGAAEGGMDGGRDGRREGDTVL